MSNNYFLDALISGDSKKITLIFEKSFPTVKKFITQNKGTTEDAEDIFQKALLQITVRHKKKPIIITSNFEAYVFTVCKNLWRRELNKSKKRVTNDNIFTLDNESFDNSIAMIEHERQELFLSKLKALSENCRNILTLFFARVPYSEIVEKSDYSSELTVRQRVFKCKKKLTELIQNDSRYNSLKEI